MGFQKCPVCNGTGKHSEFGLTDATCPVCEGKRIINEMTGRPPKDSKITIVNSITTPQSPYTNPCKHPYPYGGFYQGTPVVDTPTNISDYISELNRVAKNFELRLSNLSDIDDKDKD